MSATLTVTSISENGLTVFPLSIFCSPLSCIAPCPSYTNGGCLTPQHIVAEVAGISDVPDAMSKSSANLAFARAKSCYDFVDDKMKTDELLFLGFPADPSSYPGRPLRDRDIFVFA